MLYGHYSSTVCAHNLHNAYFQTKDNAVEAVAAIVMSGVYVGQTMRDRCVNGNTSTEFKIDIDIVRNTKNRIDYTHKHRQQKRTRALRISLKTRRQRRVKYIENKTSSRNTVLRTTRSNTD